MKIGEVASMLFHGNQRRQSTETTKIYKEIIEYTYTHIYIYIYLSICIYIYTYILRDPKQIISFLSWNRDRAHGLEKKQKKTGGEIQSHDNPKRDCSQYMPTYAMVMLGNWYGTIHRDSPWFTCRLLWHSHKSIDDLISFIIHSYHLGSISHSYEESPCWTSINHHVYHLSMGSSNEISRGHPMVSPHCHGTLFRPAFAQDPFAKPKKSPPKSPKLGIEEARGNAERRGQLENLWMAGRISTICYTCWLICF